MARDMKRATDKVVAAVLSNAPNAEKLAERFTDAVGDPQDSDFPEVASGGFVSFEELQNEYGEVDDLSPLEGLVSAKGRKALGQAANTVSRGKGAVRQTQTRRVIRECTHDSA